MSSPSCLIVALCGLSVLVTLACQDDDEPQFTPVPAMTFERGPDPVTPTRDSTVTDARTDGAIDDGGPPEAGADAATDAMPDAMPDVAPDAGEPTCFDDRDCVLAVQLDRCDPCPIPAHVDTVLDDRCRVTYILGATLGTYAPADCWAACGDAIGESCLDAAAAAVCDPPRQAGQCTLFR